VLIRAFVASCGTAAVYAMMPLVAHDVLGEGARTYGLLLGAFGVGAVSAVLLVQPLRDRLSPQASAAVLAAVTGVAILGMGTSRITILTALATYSAGAAWMLTTSLYNVCVQMSAPRWVAGRALAGFQAATAGGLALGAWGWGALAGQIGIEPALLCAGCMLILSPLVGLIARMPDARGVDTESVPSPYEPDLRIAISGRSGPIAIEVEHRVAEERAREFYDLMRHNQRVLERNGAYDVSLSRDLADPQMWLRRYHYATWHDYLRARERPTRVERDLNASIAALQLAGAPLRVRRVLERPLGSVRWKDTTQDQATVILPGDI
jgi:hypothetical protein